MSQFWYSNFNYKNFDIQNCFKLIFWIDSEHINFISFQHKSYSGSETYQTGTTISWLFLVLQQAYPVSCHILLKRSTSTDQLVGVLPNWSQLTTISISLSAIKSWLYERSPFSTMARIFADQGIIGEIK